MAENKEQPPQGWEITDGLEFTGMIHLFWRVLQRFGYSIPPTYVGKEFQEHGVPSCVIHVAVPANYSVIPTWESWTLSITGTDLPSTWNVAAFKALTRFCEDHKHDVAGTPVALLSINDVTDFEWMRHVDFIFDPNHRHHDPMLPLIEYYGLSTFALCTNLC